MNIKIPFHFVARAKHLIDWADIVLAYDNGLIDSQTVIDFACEEVSKHDTDCQAVLDLACARASDPLVKLMSKITIANFNASESKKKWAFILAAYIAERDDLDQLTEVENVYSSYDYPSELSAFVRYMPMQGPDLGSTRANEERMIKSLKEFGKTIVGTAAATTDVDQTNQRR